MKRIILLLAFVANMLALNAQDSLYAESRILAGFSAGLNINKFSLPFEDLSPGTSPSFGLFQVIRLSNSFSLKLDEKFSRRKSVIMHPYRKIVGNYIDISVLPQFRLTDVVAFQAGLIVNGYVDDISFSELNAVAGANIRLQQRLNLDVTYQLPLAKDNTSTLNVSLNYIINKRKHKQPRQRKIERNNRISKIEDLNNGILLVRLKDWEQKTDAYEQSGDSAEANRLAAFRKSQNLAIMEAFKNQYHFSEVAFFMSRDSKKIKDGNFEGVFLNDSLQKDSSITIDKSKPRLIGEVDFLEADTSKHWQSSHYNIYTKKYEKIYYSNSADFSRCAIVIRDANFVQMRKPFPYYVSCQTELKDDPLVNPVNVIIKRNFVKAVSKLDSNLNYFHQKFFNEAAKQY